MEIKRIFCFLLVITFVFSQVPEEDTVAIDDYDYPKPNDSNYDYIAILSTNDIHGSYFPKKLEYENTTYESGGLEYLGKYISILQEQWKNNFLWLDAGDQFQGTVESQFSQGQIITDFFNTMNLSAATIGNHEWDSGSQFLLNKLNSSNFPYLASNIELPIEVPKLLKTKIFNFTNEIRIGVIGLAKNVASETSSGNLQGIKFSDYKVALENSIDAIQDNVDAIIILSHIDQKCQDEDDALLKNDIRNKDSEQGKCSEESEIFDLIKKVDKTKITSISGIIAGHNHAQTHHWINGIPVMSNINAGRYTSVMYLPFEKGTRKLVKDQIKIEGPLPVCEKIFSKTKRCDPINTEKTDEIGSLTNFKFHGVTIDKEKNLENVTQKYIKDYELYTGEITKIDGEIITTNYFENGVGNLYTDIMRKVTGADIAIINKGNLRKNFTQGSINLADLYESTPYDNKVVTFKMTGSQILKMLKNIEEGDYALYSVSGLSIVVRHVDGRGKFLSAKLFDGVEEKNLKAEEVYTVASLDFLIEKGGDDFKRVIKWYNCKEEINGYNNSFGTLKELSIEYLRNVDELKVSNLINKEIPRIRTIY